jgi:hypothetical protein
MANPQGRLRYAGVWADGAFSVTRTSSTRPDQIRAQFILGVDLPLYGNIEIWYGAQRIVLPDCRLALESIKGGSNGRMRDVTFLDRRWKWQYVTAFGEYNNWTYGQDHYKYYLAFGEKNNRQLVKILLGLLGETSVDATSVSDELKQAIHFDGKPCAGVLDNLLEINGARLNLRWDNSVKIDVLGTGRNPPNDQRVMDYTLTQTPPVIPQTLLIEPEQTTFTNDFYLEPVGYEIDANTGNILTETLKRIDDLSWKPAKGWDPPLFHNVNKKWMSHARQFIYKLFRLRRPWSDRTLGQKLQLVEPVMRQRIPRQQWFDADDFKLSYVDEDFARLDFHIDTKVEPLVYGYHNLNQTNGLNNLPFEADKIFDISKYRKLSRTDLEKYTVDAGIVYKGQFHFDAAKQLVRFDHPIWFVRRAGNGDGNLLNPTIGHPRIAIRLDHQLRRKADNEYLRQMYLIENNGPNVARGVTKTIRSPFVRYHRSEVEGETTSERTFREECLAAARAEQSTYRMLEAASIPMKGFCFDINTDGSIGSVTFDRDSEGRCTTTVEWKTENPYLQPTYAEKVEKMNRKAIFDAVYRQEVLASRKKLGSSKRSHQ